MKSNLLREDVRKYVKIIKRRAIKSLLGSIIRKPTIIPTLIKLTREHERQIKEENLDLINNVKFLPSEKRNKDYMKIARKLSDDTIVPFNKECQYLPNVTIANEEIEGISCEWVIPPNEEKGKVIIHIHGGAYVLGSPKAYYSYAAKLSTLTGCKVLIPDYSLAPEYKYPHGLNNVTTIYQTLLDTGYSANNVIISGDSAGGGLALALLHKIRDNGIQSPSATILISPHADFSFEEKEFYQKASRDPIVADMPMYYYFRLYFDPNKENIKNPYLSPIYGDFTDFPPILLIVSKSEMLYHTSIRIFEKISNIGGEVELIDPDDMPHIYPCIASTQDWLEIEEVFDKMSQFISKHIVQEI